MAKYHINDKGNPGKCTAQSGNCPFGGEDQLILPRKKPEMSTRTKWSMSKIDGAALLLITLSLEKE
jgi:hypothetical protein